MTTSIDIPEKMVGVALTGHGGPEVLQVRDDLPVPKPGPGEVLIKVEAAGINNTDINTRTGWYSKSVSGASGDSGEVGETGDGGWSGAISFPRIQGADCCGTIVAVGEGVSAERIGETVIVVAMQNGLGDGSPYSFGTFGSECDGSFAEYCTALAGEARKVESPLSAVELGALPCAYSTAEGMLQRVGLKAGETVFVTGASGGVGLAAVQLATLRDATAIAQSAASKAEVVRQNGAARVVDRDADLSAAVEERSVDVVIDLVAGPQFPELIRMLRPGGRYVTSGAIAGPEVALDVRDLYLKDLTFFGSTWQPDSVFEAIVSYANDGRIKPVISKTYPLRDIGTAQADFMSKKYPGKLVLIP